MNASPEPVRQLKIFFLTERAIARACEEKIKCDDYRKKGGEAKSIVEVEETHVVRCSAQFASPAAPLIAALRAHP